MQFPLSQRHNHQNQKVRSRRARSFGVSNTCFTDGRVRELYHDDNEDIDDNDDYDDNDNDLENAQT